MSSHADRLRMLRTPQPPAGVDIHELMQALRDLVAAVEIAEDNDWSESSRRLISNAADRASALSVRVPRRH